MTTAVVVFLLGLALPLFISSWRTALAGLAVQGGALAVLVVLGGHAHSASGTVLLADLALMRGVFTPWYLAERWRRGGSLARLDLIPANLVHWALAAFLLALGLWFGTSLAPAESPEALLLAAVASAVLLGTLILASQPRPEGEVVGALVIENGVVLLEIFVGAHLPLAAQVGVAAIYLLTVLRFGWFAQRLHADLPDEPDAPMGFL
jgi:hydrogenase-4 membrane subunit HyfE